MKKGKVFLLFFFSILTTLVGRAQEIPLVYDLEHTGADCPAPVLPAFQDLPVIEPLTDPFAWSDGRGRDTTFAAWRCRRAEIKAELERYEIGIKPGRPDSITASYANGLLTVNITVNGEMLTLTSTVVLPEGEGPFPAVIGMGGGSGSLPADIFSSRNIAQVSFNFSQVMAHTQGRGKEPINKLYPDLIYMGAYSAWPWGVSRLIDGLELVSDVLPIDLSRLAVTGCSFAGKMALFAGALDERIALTIAQESGGGGAAAWRVSETLGDVEKLSNTSGAWFISDMFQFSGKNVSKLPHDHHELMALIAPRALFVLGNPDYVWLADESGYISCRAAHEVWKNFGIADRFGFSILGGHTHCGILPSQRPEIEAFVEKFMLGDTTVNTNITTHTYPNVDYSRWYEWWGSDTATFALRDRFGSESIWLEAECGEVGYQWNVMDYPIASNASVVTAKSGINNSSVAPEDSSSTIYYPFTVTCDTTYHIFARIYCPTNKGNALWLKMDDGSFKKVGGLNTVGLQWKKLLSTRLTPGEHYLAVAFTESGTRLDKFCISNLSTLPALEGEAAENACIPVQPVGVGTIAISEGFSLGQNVPNPVKGKTRISFSIPNDALVSLKVYNAQGIEVADLAGGMFPGGSHSVDYDPGNVPPGIYVYTL
nr:hypothetical protein [Prolixibacteraceae bacterium]